MARQDEGAFRGPTRPVRRPLPAPVVSGGRFHIPLHGRQCRRHVRHSSPTQWADRPDPLRRIDLGALVWVEWRIVVGWIVGRRILRRRRLVGRRRGIGELVMPITENDRIAIEAAIREAEKRTCGQIVCVLARSSSDYSAIPIEWAAVLAL